MHDKTLRLEQLMPLIRERLANGESVQFTTNGTSMRPMLGNGENQVILSPLPEKLQKYDLPLYQRDNGQYVLHRIVKAGRTYTCIGDNQFSYETGVRPDQMIALATGFVRKGKIRSTSGLSYKIYCRLWCWSRPVRLGLIRVKNLFLAAGSKVKRKLFGP